MADGCPEKISLEFLLYTARFPFAARRRTDARLKQFAGKRIHLTSSAQVRRFLASIDRRG